MTGPVPLNARQYLHDQIAALSDNDVQAVLRFVRELTRAKNIWKPSMLTTMNQAKVDDVVMRTSETWIRSKPILFEVDAQNEQDMWRSDTDIQFNVDAVSERISLLKSILTSVQLTAVLNSEWKTRFSEEITDEDLLGLHREWFRGE